MGITTTSPYGRANIAWPDFAHDGGTALHTKITNSIAKLSNNQDSRWSGEVTLADTASESIVHDFGMALEDLQVRIYESGVLISLEDQTKNYSITQTDTDTIAIQNVSGGSKTFFAYVWGFDVNRLIGRFAAQVTTTTNVPSKLIDVPLRGNESAMLRFMVHANKDTSTANSYVVTVQAENNAGTVTVTEIGRTELEETAALTVAITGFGNNVRCLVTGEVGVTHDWYAVAETTYF